ncbi:hypothetical protein B0H66DRAFT_600618 [Apodospora peruviana]|uniref:Uncharacterized protein n=1 Tax=Apodospora peruviana TaxID=516989 RepID=A0AAE0IK28_9PEZI|nr:hypothetical protein B0H66DRAFT_600618 [Apodospora peruviana]
MAFGNSVSALLETYSNCLALLKAFKHHDGNSILGADGQKARLRKSLKADRKLVERTYSAKLSQAGSRLEKGDGRAISVLDRILKKLRAAIASLLRLGSNRKNQPALDYDSLKSLSNASRIEAIQAIDHLSRRLSSSPSRSTLISYSSTSSSSRSSTTATPPPGHTRRSKRHASSPSSSSSSGSSGGSSRLRKSASSPSAQSQDPLRKKTPPIMEEEYKDDGEAILPAAAPVTNNKQKHSSSKKKSSSKLRKGEGEKKQPHHGGSNRSSQGDRNSSPKDRALPAAAPAQPNRISMMSVATDSTNLGEIPERKWRTYHHAAAVSYSSDEYNVAPLYPLKPYATPERVKKKQSPRFWGGLFGRNRKDN